MSNMETKLIVEQAKILAGRDIRSLSFETNNQALQLSLKPLSKLLFFALECDSNNTVRTMIPRDIKTIRNQFEYFKRELVLAQKHADQPMGKLEVMYKLLVPHPVEMKKFSNGKLERVADQIMNLIRVCMMLDGAGSKNFVMNQDYTTINEAIKVVEEVMDLYIGSGDKTADGWDTGMDLEPMPELGTLVPDNDLDSAEMKEPSADKSNQGYVRVGAPK